MNLNDLELSASGDEASGFCLEIFTRDFDGGKRYIADITISPETILVLRALVKAVTEQPKRRAV